MTRCDWADPNLRSTRCERPGAVLEDGWHHCPRHLALHIAERDRVIIAAAAAAAAAHLLANPPRREKTAKCGTRSGYQRHQDRKEKVCAECKAVQKAYDKARSEKSSRQKIRYRRAT